MATELVSIPHLLLNLLTCISFTDPRAQFHYQIHHSSVFMHHGCRTACSQLLIWLETMPLQTIAFMTRRYIASLTYMLYDLVWLYLPASQKGTSYKLDHPWTSPFKVGEKKANVIYSIQQQLSKQILKIVPFDS